MIRKGRLWYADWFTPQGKRQRKGFKTSRAAIRYQNKMRTSTAEIKKARALRAFRLLRKHGLTRRAPVTTRRPQLKNTRGRLARARSKTSARTVEMFSSLDGARTTRHRRPTSGERS
jgi:hypothetical protein